MRRRAALLALSLVIAVSAPLAATSAPAPEPRGHSGPASVVRHTHAELLSARLAQARPGERIAVIVSGLGVRGARADVGGFTVRHRLPLVRGFSAAMTAEQVRRIDARPGVTVQLVRQMRISDAGTTRDFGVAAARTDRPGLAGTGIGICAVDTGVDPAHEQIAGRSVTFKDFIRSNGSETQLDPAYDDHGHGTHVMSIAAGDGVGGASAPTYQGVAPGASLYAAKVLDSAGSGPNDGVIKGIQWCAAQPGVRVISLSLGDPGIVPNGEDDVSRAVDAAVTTAGKVVTVAAGNSGDLPGTITVPGDAVEAITVGAVSDHSNPAGTASHDDGIFLAPFSSRGPTAAGLLYPARTKPDISAPGVSVTAARAGTTAGYATFDGTSMATPFVAGAVALALEAAPSATPAQVKAAVMSSAIDVGAPAVDNEYGAGYLDVRALVDTVAGAITVRHADFPVQEYVAGTVPTNGSADIPITIGTDGLGVPLAISMVIDGQAICYFGSFPNCFYAEWSPDFDMQLLNPGGAVVADSRCALDGLWCVTGRQETIGVVPTLAGIWRLHVWTDTGSNNSGKSGTFGVTISHGPVGAATPPPPPPTNAAPTADAGPDQTLVVKGKNGKAGFTLNGTASSDPDGDSLSYVWTLNGKQVGTTATLSQNKGIGSYTYVLTVNDGHGHSASDSVVITVRR